MPAAALTITACGSLTVPPTANMNNSLYFTDQGWAGGLVFAYWNNDVKQYLIENAKTSLRGIQDRRPALRRGERDGPFWRLDHLPGPHRTLRAAKPEAIQIAEYWPVNDWIVRDRGAGGAGFDATWSDGLRSSVRAAISSAAHGATAHVPMTAIAGAIESDGLRDRWRAVQIDREPRHRLCWP